MTEEEFVAEIRRRLDPDAADGGYAALGLHVAVNDCGYTLEELGPNDSRRLWMYGKGRWDPERWTRWAKPLFTSEDEFGNTLICLRLPQGRLLLLALNVPLKNIPYDPDGGGSRWVTAHATGCSPTTSPTSGRTGLCGSPMWPVVTAP